MALIHYVNMICDMWRCKHPGVDGANSLYLYDALLHKHGPHKCLLKHMPAAIRTADSRLSANMAHFTIHLAIKRKKKLKEHGSQ